MEKRNNTSNYEVCSIALNTTDMQLVPKFLAFSKTGKRILVTYGFVNEDMEIALES